MLYFLTFNFCKSDFGELCNKMKDLATESPESNVCKFVMNVVREKVKCDITKTGVKDSKIVAKADGSDHAHTLLRVFNQVKKIPSFVAEFCKSEEVSPAQSAQSVPSGPSGVSIAALVICSFALVGVGALAFMKLSNRNE